MKVFFGSSSESRENMEELASWVEQSGLEPLLWTDSDAFPLGTFTLERLIELTDLVSAAVFVLGEDDRVWYRGAEHSQARDNVLLEYGLFASKLGRTRCIVCRVDSSKTASDLAGLTLLHLAAGKRIAAKRSIAVWAASVRDEIQRLREQGVGLPNHTTNGTTVSLPRKCEHVARASLTDEVRNWLEEHPGWFAISSCTEEEPPKPTQELKRLFRFVSFNDAVRFMSAAAESIDRLDHHPRWENIYDQVVVQTTTWNIGNKISALDFQLAEYLERLYSENFEASATSDHERKEG